ncbi:winged helix-turn-helix domain-containing protein [Actinospica robiniae]|uniref:winged helix-turn-helix domain-containing protein n=1 Tax=Actinospica robiniae TaxID=304901 RepID=UPI00041DFFB3|nr:helix-turn-helix domain-containing protein [Actinospica robiniae]
MSEGKDEPGADSAGKDGAPAPVKLHKASDPRELRALAHPVRLALYEALGVHGDLTATQASKLLGGSPTSVAYHLRTLAKYGYVEEAGGGEGRERPWRLGTVGFEFDREDPAPGVAAAARALGDLMFQRWLERRARYRAEASKWPAEVRDVVGDFRFMLFGTPEEMRELEQAWTEVIMRYYARIQDPSLRPEGSIPFELNLFVNPAEAVPPDRPDDTNADITDDADN